MTAREPRRRRSWWAKAARAGQTAWFFGNLYEAVVGMPQLLADARSQRATGLLAAGSPVRYYAPVAPVAFGATALALSEKWRSGADRRVITASATCMASAAGLSAYLIRTVNVRLLTSGAPLTEHERRGLVDTWHRVNAIRLGLLAGALVSFSHVTSQRPPQRVVVAVRDQG